MTMRKTFFVWFGLLGISAALVSAGHAQMAGFDADKPGVMRASLGSVDVKAEITKVDDFMTFGVGAETTREQELPRK